MSEQADEAIFFRRSSRNLARCWTAFTNTSRLNWAPVRGSLQQWTTFIYCDLWFSTWCAGWEKENGHFFLDREKTGEFFYFFLSNFRHLRIKSRFDDNAEYRINGSMVWGLQVLYTFVSLASHYRLRAWELFTVVYYPVSVRWGAPFCRWVEIVCTQIVFICWSRDREKK